MYTKNEMLEYLREDMVKLEFAKKDGTTRPMTATLKQDLIPDEKKPKGVKPAQPESSIIRVFDLELKEFRSVNTDTVSKFVIVE